MAIGNIDLNQEIESWKSAVYGKDVRSANVAAFEKIQGTVNDTVQNVNQAAEDSASAAHNAQAAVDSIQAAIVTATEKAAAAATSATQAAGSQAAADSSKTAAAQSATDAITAKTAAEAARDATEHIAGFDGTAASVKATDTYGLVVDALGESTAQALIDAVANKVMNELVTKSQIINNLLATVPGNALDAVQGKTLMDLYTQLNGDALIIAYPIDINMDTAPGLSQNMIYFYQNHFYIGYSMTVSGKLYGAQLRFGHWLTRPEYRYNQGALWTDWAAL